MLMLLSQNLTRWASLYLDHETCSLPYLSCGSTRQVLELPSVDERCIDLVKSFSLKKCWVMLVDDKGSISERFARALLPTGLKVCIVTEKVSISEPLSQLEADLCLKARRKLKAVPSTTAADLGKLASQLPSMPELRDQGVLECLSVAKPQKAYYNTINLTPTDVRVVTCERDPSEMLMPDALVVARDSVANGLVAAPSLLVRGLAGVWQEKEPTVVC